jgi:FixJ family two-component response regulator
MKRVVAGLLNKQIDAELGTSEANRQNSPPSGDGEDRSRLPA